ncbi:hypothetical protein BDR05DRAFT_958891 [Suillus weaverae]|nr:hypothetical protein BDR05DRAFT_958891 [Suillus weaverae]
MIASRRIGWLEYVQNERMMPPAPGECLFIDNKWQLILNDKPLLRLRTVVRRNLITVKKGSRSNSSVQVVRGLSWLEIGWSPLLASGPQRAKARP